MSDALTFPISEIFGPTIQGEGSMIGRQTLFVRFAGCDYRCSWCDTKYAAYAEEVRAAKASGEVVRMARKEIVDRCLELSDLPGSWITFSGGNPALFNTRLLIQDLHAEGFHVAMETQGSAVPFPRAMELVDHLILSPKPPSSGMETDWDILKECRQIGELYGRVAFKVVIFNMEDLEYATRVRQNFPKAEMWLSAGTPQDEPDLLRSSIELESNILNRTRWLAEMVCGPYQTKLIDVGVLPQLHVLLWGTERGV
jgi:7-carboxy-7-deazaguanine synthase